MQCRGCARRSRRRGHAARRRLLSLRQRRLARSDADSGRQGAVGRPWRDRRTNPASARAADRRRRLRPAGIRRTQGGRLPRGLSQRSCDRGARHRARAAPAGSHRAAARQGSVDTPAGPRAAGRRGPDEPRRLQLFACRGAGGSGRQPRREGLRRLPAARRPGLARPRALPEYRARHAGPARRAPVAARAGAGQPRCRARRSRCAHGRQGRSRGGARDRHRTQPRHARSIGRRSQYRHAVDPRRLRA